MANITNTISVNSVKWSKLHIYFFYLFLFSIPFQTRKVFLTQHSFYSGAFTEYATFFIYASDIFLILALFFWLVFNKLELFRSSRPVAVSQQRTATSKRTIRCSPLLRDCSEAEARKDHKHKTIKLHKIWLFLFIFIIWLMINTIINNNYLEISAFQIIKFIELFLLLTYIYFNLINKKILLTSLFVISLTGFLQGLIAIYQFIFQHSLFNSPILAKITGETAIGPQIPGIAKIVVDGERMIRAYGTFPHSNILGGFLIFSIIISIYLLLEHKHTLLSRYKLNYIQFYNTKLSKSQVQTTISLLWIVIIFTQITALLFTFSRSAWAGFMISTIALTFLLYIKRFSNVSRETIYNKIENSKLENSNNLNIVSRETIFRLLLKNLNILLKQKRHETISPSNYANEYNLELQDNTIVSRETTSSENNNKFNIVSRETMLNFKRKLNCYFLAIFAAFLFIGFFDHYFWTLQQGRLIFWLVLGILLIDMKILSKKT